MAKQKYYVVRVGRQPGVYDNWNDCEEQILNFPGAKYKKLLVICRCGPGVSGG